MLLFGIQIIQQTGDSLFQGLGEGGWRSRHFGRFFHATKKVEELHGESH